MAVETDTERAIFFDTDDFGEAVTFSNGGSPTSINVIFDIEYRAYDSNFVQVAGDHPMCICRSSDVSGADTDDTIIRSGTTYSIVSIEPDGTGMTTLMLEDQ